MQWKGQIKKNQGIKMKNKKTEGPKKRNYRVNKQHKLHGYAISIRFC